MLEQQKLFIGFVDAAVSLVDTLTMEHDDYDNDPFTF